MPSPPLNRFIQTTVEFALGAPATAGQGPGYAPSNLCVRWDGAGHITDRNGHQTALQTTDQSDAPWALPKDHPVPKLRRAVDAINALTRLSASRDLVLDMQDARPMGLTAPLHGHDRILAYNRRRDAAGLALWPLKGYHDVGDPFFFRPLQPDPEAYAEKRDQVFWRGKLTGSTEEHLGADPKRRQPSHKVLNQIAAGHVAAQEALKRLYTIPRYAFVSAVRDLAHIDAALTVPHRFRDLKDAPLFTGLTAPRVPPERFSDYRYMLCISGFDAPSNFPMAMSSNATVFVEDHPWEHYYHWAFKPWEHFIPVAKVCADLDEKLSWARDNPKACEDMIAARVAPCAALSDPEVQQAIMAGIADGLGLRQRET